LNSAFNSAVGFLITIAFEALVDWLNSSSQILLQLSVMTLCVLIRDRKSFNSRGIVETLIKYID